MTSPCAALPAKYANPFGTNDPAVLALLRTQRRGVSYAPATMKNRHWAAVELYCFWMWGLLPHLPREVQTSLPLHLPERPTFDAIKCELAGKLQGCTCENGIACHVATLTYIADAKGYPVHPPLRRPVPERKRHSSPAERDELARRAYSRSNRWGM